MGWTCSFTETTNAAMLSLLSVCNIFSWNWSKLNMSQSLSSVCLYLLYLKFTSLLKLWEALNQIFLCGCSQPGSSVCGLSAKVKIFYLETHFILLFWSSKDSCWSQMLILWWSPDSYVTAKMQLNCMCSSNKKAVRTVMLNTRSVRSGS